MTSKTSEYEYMGVIMTKSMYADTVKDISFRKANGLDLFAIKFQPAGFWLVRLVRAQ